MLTGYELQVIIVRGFDDDPDSEDGEASDHKQEVEGEDAVFDQLQHCEGEQRIREPGEEKRQGKSGLKKSTNRRLHNKH